MAPEPRPARAEPVPATRELTRASDAELLTMITAEAEMTEEEGATGEQAGAETMGHPTRCGEPDFFSSSQGRRA